MGKKQSEVEMLRIPKNTQYTVEKRQFLKDLEDYNNIDVISLCLIHRSFLYNFTILVPTISEIMPRCISIAQLVWKLETIDIKKRKKENIVVPQKFS
jgi:hypothetical protein